MPNVEWPSREEAERWEIQGFIDHYRRLPGQRMFDVVRRQERPNWIVRNSATGELIGVELTSVYLDDRSVPDRHHRGSERRIPYRRDQIAAYGRRVAAAVQKKVWLARGGYDHTVAVGRARTRPVRDEPCPSLRVSLHREGGVTVKAELHPRGLGSPELESNAPAGEHLGPEGHGVLRPPHQEPL